MTLLACLCAVQGGAPDVSSYRESRPSAYPSVPVDNTRTPPADWQAHKTGATFDHQEVQLQLQSKRPFLQKADGSSGMLVVAQCQAMGWYLQ